MCPYCMHTEGRVVDSRPTRNSLAIRRRRECFHCGRRFTTYERVELVAQMVIKRDGKREPFNRDKIVQSMCKAFAKGHVEIEDIRALADEVENEAFAGGETEVPTSRIAELVMAKLKQRDHAAYVRFAVTYRKFTDMNDILRDLITQVGSQTAESLLREVVNNPKH